MSIIISGIKLPFETLDSDAISAAVKLCNLSETAVRSSAIYKKSFDLRKGTLSKVYSVELDTGENSQVLTEKIGLQNVRAKAEVPTPKITGDKRLQTPPIIVGFGPAGIFSALVLAEMGYKPVVFERGNHIAQRDKDVKSFFGGESLDVNSNVQFGEGGAGAYSDGKLTTRINDPRCELIFKYLQDFGAPKDIACSAKPHIGTDLLKKIVVAMRKRIIELGGTVHFDVRVDSFTVKENKAVAVNTSIGSFPCEIVILAPGHSARDTFKMLRDSDFALQRKPFSAGVRIEHLQEDIDRALYGKFAGKKGLPPGEYSLSNRVDNRACYSFCMCPGGFVVAAASELGGVVTNGMSYHARSGKNANSALAVSILPEDFEGSDPLSGMYFQQKLEREAYKLAGSSYSAPVQQFGDFVEDRKSKDLGRVKPTYSPGYELCNLNKILPPDMCDMLKDSMIMFGGKLKGFNASDSVLTGVETRTSSPVRVERRENMESVNVSGIIPCGEGAGYAGGIMSAAVDGIKAAQQILAQYKPKE